ncbi:MAG: hypothetical protein L0K86_06450 [Actinomycetia bacterium]|nr:hypothetical protein [Actinomycetes bacterium]
MPSHSAVDLGVEPTPGGAELAWARGQVVVASSAVLQVPPLGPVSVKTRDLESFAADTRALRRFGFHGRACIHPRQVDAVRTVYEPTPDEIAWARDVLARLDEARGGAVVDASGRMLDEAVARRARVILG